MKYVSEREVVGEQGSGATCIFVIRGVVKPYNQRTYSRTLKMSDLNYNH